MDAYQLRLPDYSLDIPPFLQRAENNTWRYPQLHDGTLYPKPAAPPSGTLSTSVEAKTTDRPVLPALPSDPYEKLAVIAALPRGAPPPLQRDTPSAQARRAKSYQRVNKVLAKKSTLSVPLTGRDALRRIRGED
jgi:hypothetical protein